MSRRSTCLTLSALVATLVTPGCSSQIYRPASSWRIRPDAPLEIDEEDVATAFSARPQLPPRIRLAYFTLDRDSREDTDRMLRRLAGVEDVYEIAPLLVTGEHRFRASSSEDDEPNQIDMRQLRLLAARAHCDALVILDRSARIDAVPNGWVAFSPLLVPLFFTPFLDYEVQTYLDVYLIDVRNGYLYGHVTSHEHERVNERMLYDDTGPRLVEQQRVAVLGEGEAALLALLTEGTMTGAGSHRRTDLREPCVSVPAPGAASASTST